MRAMSRRSLLVMTLTLSLLSSGANRAQSAEEKPMKSGKRIVFLGDSITQAGAAPGGYVTLVNDSLKKAGQSPASEIIGAGISGNKVPDLEKRLDNDVLARKPDLVVIYIGINDVWHSMNGKGTPKTEFDAGLRRIIKRINDAGARVILCTASVIGEKTDGSNPLDKMLEEYCEISRTVAKETKSQLLDLHQQFAKHLKEHNPSNADKNVLTSDGVHLNEAGNRFVADRMLEALALASAPSKSDKQLRHFVAFKFKDEVTPEQVTEVVKAFAALPGKIDTITDFETGTDVSVEMKADGFTHAFLVTFADEKGREVYLPHPAHQEFVKLVGPRVEKVFVFDYWTK